MSEGLVERLRAYREYVESGSASELRALLTASANRITVLEYKLTEAYKLGFQAGREAGAKVARDVRLRPIDNPLAYQMGWVDACEQIEAGLSKTEPPA